MATRFLLVKCAKCKNKQPLYEKAAMQVRCLKCNAVLAEPRGGKARILAKIVKELK